MPTSTLLTPTALMLTSNTTPTADFSPNSTLHPANSRSNGSRTVPPLTGFLSNPLAVISLLVILGVGLLGALLIGTFFLVRSRKRRAQKKVARIELDSSFEDEWVSICSDSIDTHQNNAQAETSMPAPSAPANKRLGRTTFSRPTFSLEFSKTEILYKPGPTWPESAIALSPLEVNSTESCKPNVSPNTARPSTGNSLPSTANARPSDGALRPSITMPRPSTASARPSTTIPRPSTASARPSFGIDRPSIAITRPSTANPALSTSDSIVVVPLSASSVHFTRQEQKPQPEKSSLSKPVVKVEEWDEDTETYGHSETGHQCLSPPLFIPGKEGTQWAV